MEDLPKGLASSGAVKIEKRLKSISGGRVLDVATGEGGFIDTLMKTLRDYDSFVGIDNSKKEAEFAKKRFKGHPVEIIHMNAEALEFGNDIFDTVCISFSLHHLDKIDKVLSEMKHVLRPRGHFIVQEMFCDGEQNKAQKTDMLQHHWDAEIDSLFSVVHNKTLTKQKIEDIVNKLKLKEVEIFESTHYVKCLFCEDKFECEDPKSKQIIKQATKEIDDALDRLRKYPDSKVRARLEEEGKKLRERVKKFGSAPASYLFCIGKK
ncbi:MAG: class I SAM-dependent methyltransferase [Candidatus Bathyarchaeota archaeon]|nr:class I SAM-dependent methyltransferase [Candidatus Bathyarchaeota archaeon]